MDRSPWRSASSTLLLVGVLVLVTLAVLGSLRASSRPVRPTAIAPAAWQATADGASADVLVVMEEQADLSAAEGGSNLEERRRQIYDALRTTALRSQADLRADLDRAGVAYRPFYIVNMMALRGDRERLTELADRPEVARIVANPRVRQSLPEPRSEVLRLAGVENIAWGVEQVNADDVWDLGYTGEGIVIAGQDTGYDWDHPALIEQYRGYNGVTATHDYNWHDAIHSPGSNCGADAPYPCDDNGHGTHTMGTMVGDDGAGQRIGVAPGAQWIGCRNMNEGVGSPATYSECFEFFLAPYPVGGDPFTEGEPSLAPHVINNSWTCPPREGCDWDTLQTVVENVRAAGILVVASAGNSGPSCSSVQDPIALYDAAYSVGATNRADAVAGFSARGPVTVDGSGRRKPDVSAPGVEVLSSVPGTGYGSMSGTSMAGPHVAGTAALLWSAAPSLVGDVDATEEIINRSARPQTTWQSCGDDRAGDVPNNVYGWGVVDALAATPRTWVSASSQAQILGGLPASAVRYTLTFSSHAPLPLTGISISDRLPMSATLSWADGDYEAEDGTVRWAVPTLFPDEVLSRSLEIALPPAMIGTRVTNTYELSAADPSVLPWEADVDVMIPWRVLLFPIFQGTPLGEP